MSTLKHYSPLEESLNIGSHGLGLLLSSVGLVLLIETALGRGDLLYLVSFTIFGSSLIALYAASTFYHSAKTPVLRARLRSVDHASIYVLIAGSYTPFALVTLHGSTGWLIFGLSWTMALIGIVLKVFYTGKFDRLSTAAYLLMGWMILFFIKPLIENLPEAGLNLLVAGGVGYTLGAILYSIKKISLNHALFHLFVLLGSGCHFFAIYLYV